MPLREDAGHHPRSCTRAQQGSVTPDGAVAARCRAAVKWLVSQSLAGSARCSRGCARRTKVTTQPSLSATTVAALGLTGEERVLKVGTGYGYQTALLARLAVQVVSIEIWRGYSRGSAA